MLLLVRGVVEVDVCGGHVAKDEHLFGLNAVCWNFRVSV